METAFSLETRDNYVLALSRGEFNIDRVKKDLEALFNVLEEHNLEKVVFDNRQLAAELRAIEKTMFAAALMNEAETHPEYMQGRILRVGVLVPVNRMPLFRAYEEMIDRVALNIESRTFNDPAEMADWLNIEFAESA